MSKNILLKLFSLFFISLLTTYSEATVVRFEFQFNGSSQEVFLDLFDTPGPNGRTAAPVTVANFLGYIDDGNGNRRYDGTFIHRSAPGFVVQGGGFIYDPSLGAFSPPSIPPLTTDPVKNIVTPADPTIVNEFDQSRSNLRGTIAMAKLGNDPDSATSQWFFNLADNSVNLDNQNGGFTVFGQVLGGGMNVIDSIAQLSTSNQGGAFTSLPVADNFTSPVTLADLVILNRIDNPAPQRLFINPAPLDFGLKVELAGPTTQDVILQNIGGVDLNIGDIGLADGLSTPFTLDVSNCANQTLQPASSCNISITFDPQAPGLFQDTFDITSNDPTQPSVTVSVAGTGAPSSATLDVTPAATVDFGNIGLADFSEQQVTVSNIGGNNLQIDSIALSNPSNTDFSIENSSTCITGTSLALSATCTVTVRLTGNTLGMKTESMTITASPNAQSTTLTLTGNIIASQADIVLPETPFDIGDTRFDIPKTSTITFGNQGADDLIVSRFNLTGTDAGDFSINLANCQRVAQNQTCQETITFTPTGTGMKTATLAILSNDPDSPPATLTLIGTASLDNDGVPDSVESGGLNGGDGNQDGIQDNQQENVASLPDTNGKYVTLETPPGITLENVAAIDNPSPNTTPFISDGTLTFPQGFYSFTLKNLTPGGNVAVSFYLTPGTSVNSYFKFGFPTVNSFPQWFQFLLENDGTGAEFSVDKVTLHYVDGGRGDNDRDASNGEIVDPGGPALITANNRSSSGGCALNENYQSGNKLRGDWLLMLLLMLFLRARIFRMSAEKDI